MMFMGGWFLVLRSPTKTNCWIRTHTDALLWQITQRIDPSIIRKVDGELECRVNVAPNSRANLSLPALSDRLSVRDRDNRSHRTVAGHPRMDFKPTNWNLSPTCSASAPNPARQSPPRGRLFPRPLFLLRRRISTPQRNCPKNSFQSGPGAHAWKQRLIA